VAPPTVDQNGYGLRVPGIVVSPYARHGYIGHQVLSFDAYDKFIEDDFLNGQRLDPAADGRPDPRPGVRENEKILGNLINDFDFSQRPGAPVVLPVHPGQRSPAPRTPRNCPPPPKPLTATGKREIPRPPCASSSALTVGDMGGWPADLHAFQGIGGAVPVIGDRLHLPTASCPLRAALARVPRAQA